MTEVTSFKTITLDLRPDVVKFWPADHRYAVAGTYTLIEDDPSQSEETTSQQRVGSLNLIQVKDGDINIVQTLPTPFGVYDLHFTQTGAEGSGNSPALSYQFAVATSTGSVALYQLRPAQANDPTFPHPNIYHQYTLQYFSKDILITSLAWHAQHDVIAMTLSSGQVCLGRVRDPELNPALSVELMQHDFQAWTCSFVYHSGDAYSSLGLLSGGDDATLRYTSITEHHWSALEMNENTRNAVIHRTPWVDKRIHQAGVTAVMPLTSSDGGFHVLTGSYDDHIRMVHIPHTGRPSVVAEAYLGGGVFRIKIAQHMEEFREQSPPQALLTDNRIVLLVSCMQAGARIVHLSQVDGEWSFDVQEIFAKNEGTLLYASDCQDGKNRRDPRTIISTSFEDRKLYLWTTTLLY